MERTKEEPLVSVIVTTYKRKELLKETIDSILNQTFREFELIVVDNFSDYDFFDHIESFNDKRIIPFQNRNNGIIATNRNFGIRIARGEYIAFCDDDDLWMSNKLEEQLKHFGDDIIGVGSSAINVGDLSLHRQGKIIKNDLLLGFNDLLSKRTAPLSSLIVRNEEFMFSEKEHFKFVEDFDFQLKITSETNKKIKIISEPLIYYRIHSYNESRNVTAAASVFCVAEKYRHSISEEQMDKLYYKYYFNLGVQALRGGNRHADKYFMLASNYSSYKKMYLAILLALISKLPKALVSTLLIASFKAPRFISLEYFEID